MRQILIIADDLSGAADCGIACASFGLNAVVVLRGGAAELEADVLSVDADTRCLNSEMAAEETVKLMQQYKKEEQLVFKKLDSTLRGNVGSELAAVLQAQRSFNPERGNKRGHIVAVMAPAFPAHGRTTSQGRQLLNGRPLEEMEIWKREGRAGRSHIPGMLQAVGMRATLLGLDAVRSSNGGLRRAMVELAEGTDVLVCDAETDQDLRAIADAGVALGRGTVWAGSAGLAYHLPNAAGLARTSPSISQQALASGPTLFVIGSVSSASREQVKVLASSSDAITIAIPPSDLLVGPQSTKWREHELTFLKALESGRDVVALLRTEDGETEDNGKPKVDKARGRLLSSALAQMVAPHAGSFGALVATGGETARSVLQAWGVSALRLIGELESGVPFSVTENWSRHLPVLTKAGDFGKPQTLLHCQRFLHGLDRASAATIYQGKGL